MTDAKKIEGQVFFWDPAKGDDAKDGLTVETAKRTWGGSAGANSLVTANMNDTVIVVPGYKTIDETVLLTKRNVFLRWPGRKAHFRLEGPKSKGEQT